MAQNSIMDPIEKVFRDLPSPAADQAALDQHGVWEQHSMWAQFFSKDQDYEVLRSGLGRFALDKPQIRDDGSAKSQQLKYHAWISRGRKDEEYPFKDKKCPEEQRLGVPEGSHAFLPDKLTDSKFCDHCGKPDAEEACSGCLVKLDSHVVMKTAYCNKACQTQDWKEHKFVCVGRRKVCRAVSIICDLFVMFQKKAWINKPVVGIAEKQGITYITHDESDERAFQGKPVVRDFSSDLAPSEEHALAALLNGECQQLLCICQGLIKLLLMPLCQSLQEVQIMPRNAHRPTCHIRHGQAHNTMYSQHTLLCAMLKSDELMAIDIAGAQFGWREKVAEWSVWTSHRVAGKPCPKPFDYAHQSTQALYSLLAPQHAHVSEAQRSSLAQQMQVAIEKTMKENKAPSAVELYKLDDAAFALCKQAMLSSAEEALDNGLREIRASKVGLWYMDARGLWQATTTKQQARALRRVWLTDEDIKKAKEKGVDPRTIYESRCKNEGRRQKFKAAGLNMP